MVGFAIWRNRAEIYSSLKDNSHTWKCTIEEGGFRLKQVGMYSGTLVLQNCFEIWYLMHFDMIPPPPVLRLLGTQHTS